MPFKSERQRKAAFAKKGKPMQRKKVATTLRNPVILGVQLKGTTRQVVEYAFETPHYSWSLLMDPATRAWVLEQFVKVDGEWSYTGSSEHDTLKDAVQFAKGEDP